MKKGDKVEVVNMGNIYTTYESCFKKYKVPFVKQLNNETGYPKNEVLTVVKLAKHEDKRTELVFVKDSENKHYLFGECGLKVTKKKIPLKITPPDYADLYRKLQVTSANREKGYKAENTKLKNLLIKNGIRA